MKIIRISTEAEVSLHDFPEGDYSEQRKYLCSLIDEKCDTIEHVMPRRLYSALGASPFPTHRKGECASILVDEDGHYHQLPLNPIGCLLYESDFHGYPILGNILIIGEFYRNDGIDFCGLSDEQFNIIYPKIKKLAEKARKCK